MDDAFAESLVHARAALRARVAASLWGAPSSAHVVLGRRLRPLSFWHRFALDALQSPFAGHPGPFDLASLDLAVKVCCSQRPHLIGRVSRCGGVWRTLHACLLQYRYGRADRLAAELDKFFEYRADFERGPDFAESPESERVKTPWYQYAVLQLLQHDPELRRLPPRVAEQRAWMMPVGAGLWRIVTLAEARGEKVNIRTEEDREAYAEAGWS